MSSATSRSPTTLDDALDLVRLVNDTNLVFVPDAQLQRVSPWCARRGRWSRGASWERSV